MEKDLWAPCQLPSPIRFPHVSYFPPLKVSFANNNNNSDNTPWTETSKRRRRGCPNDEKDDDDGHSGEESGDDAGGGTSSIFLLDQEGSKFVVAEVDRTRRGRFRVEIGPQVRRRQMLPIYISECLC